MATFDQLSAEQRAIVELVLRQRQELRRARRHARDARAARARARPRRARRARARQRPRRGRGLARPAGRLRARTADGPRGHRHARPPAPLRGGARLGALAARLARASSIRTATCRRSPTGRARPPSRAPAPAPKAPPRREGRGRACRRAGCGPPRRPAGRPAPTGGVLRWRRTLPRSARDRQAPADHRRRGGSGDHRGGRAPDHGRLRRWRSKDKHQHHGPEGHHRREHRRRRSSARACCARSAPRPGNGRGGRDHGTARSPSCVVQTAGLTAQRPAEARTRSGSTTRPATRWRSAPSSRTRTAPSRAAAPFPADFAKLHATWCSRARRSGSQPQGSPATSFCAARMHGSPGQRGDRLERHHRRRPAPAAPPYAGGQQLAGVHDPGGVEALLGRAQQLDAQLARPRRSSRARGRGRSRGGG